MKKVTTAWRDDDDRGPVCTLIGEVSDDKFREAQRLFAQHTELVIGHTMEVDRGRRQLVVTKTPMPSYLYHPSSVFRRWLSHQLERHLNGDLSYRQR